MKIHVAASSGITSETYLTSGSVNENPKGGVRYYMLYFVPLVRRVFSNRCSVLPDLL